MAFFFLLVHVGGLRERKGGRTVRGKSSFFLCALVECEREKEAGLREGKGGGKVLCFGGAH